MLTSVSVSSQELMIEGLSDFPTIIDGVMRHGVQTRFRRLLDDLGELNDNNSVALWVRYYWDSQIQCILRGESYQPACLELDLTTFCDSGCFFCKEGQEKKRVNYPFEKLVSDLQDYAEVPETSMVIYSGGGEPTAYDRFAEVMEITANLGYSIYVSTHGGRIGHRQVPHSAFTDHCTILKISVGAASHDAYNQVHNKGKSPPVGRYRTVDYVLEQCQVVSRSRRTEEVLGQAIKLPRLFLAMTISPLNQHEIVLMAEKAVEAEADTLMFRPVLGMDPAYLDLPQIMEQFEQVQQRFGSDIEILTFNHRMDYAKREEDYFGQCVCHPVTSPDSAEGKAGSITPCLFRRANRPNNIWLSGGEPNVIPLREIVSGPDYRAKVVEQDTNLHAEDSTRCPRCRKVPNNIFLDILKQASPLEREMMRQVILDRYPRNPLGELIRGFH